MKNIGKWRFLDEDDIGEGGQGKVYRVIDNDKFNVSYDSNNLLARTIRNLPSRYTETMMKSLYEDFRDEIFKMFDIDNPENHGALKIIHDSEDARDP